MSIPNGFERVDRDWLTASMTSILRGAGLDDASAATLADSLTEGDMRGIPSHGAMLVPIYVARLRDGGVSARPRGEVVHDRGAIAVIDAGNAFGQLTGDQAI